MVRTISVYNDFGPKGTSVFSIDLDYREVDHRKHVFSDKVKDAIQKAWDISYQDAIKNNRVLQNKSRSLQKDSINQAIGNIATGRQKISPDIIQEDYRQPDASEYIFY